MVINRKWTGIDLMSLYSKTSFKEWNNFLTMCLNAEDILKLEQTYYGVQIGMTNLAKQKLNTAKINVWYLRLLRSIEKTVKIIYRKKCPSELDEPIFALNLKRTNILRYNSLLKIKRRRDQSYERWLTKVAF